MAAEKKKLEYPESLDNTRIIHGLKWIKGMGKMPADIMLVGDHPGPDEIATGSLFVGPSGKDMLYPTMRKAQFKYMCEGAVTCEYITAVNPADLDIYITNAVKYAPAGNKKPGTGDIKNCSACLKDEIERCSPALIVCLGSKALAAVLGKGHTLSDYRSAFIGHPDYPGTQVFTTYNPAYLLRNPEKQEEYDKDWRMLAAWQRGDETVTDKTEFLTIRTVDMLRKFKQQLFAAYKTPFLMLDCEWHGATWMSADRYIRTVQLGFEIGQAVIVEFYDEGTVPEGESWTTARKGDVMDDHPAAWNELKSILEDPRVSVGGHNVIADGEWLLQYGIDIRDNVTYDTMLAEHAFNELGPFSLGELTIKYTEMGKYDLDVHTWVKAHEKECAHGYGPVPANRLLPYAAKDVDAPRRMAIKQVDKLEPYTQPRGVQGEYPSLWDIQLDTQKTIYELERTGMLVDRERLQELTEDYKQVLSRLIVKAQALAQAQGAVDFNPRSTAQARDIMFDRLQLQPVKTTSGKPWAEFIMNQPKEAQAQYNPSTDMNTLEILQEHHPFVKTMADFRRIDTICKYFLRQPDPGFDEASRGGGIVAKIWADGRLHAHFSQLAETARFKTSKPNVQNFPKRAEGYMAKIFEEAGKSPPASIRTVIVPTPGYVLIESDFVQAELFALAALSGDVNMWETLTTPGKDMHDMTAVTSFKLDVLDADGNPVDEKYILDLAARDEDAFDAYAETLQYRKMSGEVMSRKFFRNTLRISSKNLNFG